MTYENERYWKELHGRFKGELRAVGWPSLSEAFNAAKYASETESFLKALEFCPMADERPVRAMEIGVGTGFWTALLIERFSNPGLRLTGLDISDDALAAVRARFPGVALERLDLRTVDPGRFRHQFHLVTALMVLLHLTVESEFTNALRFAARSVRPGGMLILYEPAINGPYTPWSSENPRGGNSVARTLDTYDELAAHEGLRRAAMLPGASWVLNSPIEAATSLGFRVRQATWIMLCKIIYRFEHPTAWLSPLLLRADAALKQRSAACSAKFLVYRRPAMSL